LEAEEEENARLAKLEEERVIAEAEIKRKAEANFNMDTALAELGGKYWEFN